MITSLAVGNSRHIRICRRGIKPFLPDTYYAYAAHTEKTYPTPVGVNQIFEFWIFDVCFYFWPSNPLCIRPSALPGLLYAVAGAPFNTEPIIKLLGIMRGSWFVVCFYFRPSVPWAYRSFSISLETTSARANLPAGACWFIRDSAYWGCNGSG